MTTLESESRETSPDCAGNLETVLEEKKPRRSSEPVMNSVGHSQVQDGVISPILSGHLAQSISVLLGEKLSKQLCDDLRAALHTELRGFLKDQRDAPGKLVHVFREEMHSMFGDADAPPEGRTDQSLPFCSESSSSSGSSADGSEKEEVEERSATMPDLPPLQSNGKRDRAQSSWDKQRTLKPLKLHPSSRPRSRQTSPRGSDRCVGGVVSPSLENIDEPGEPRRERKREASQSPRRHSDHDRNAPSGTSSFAAKFHSAPMIACSSLAESQGSGGVLSMRRGSEPAEHPLSEHIPKRKTSVPSVNIGGKLALPPMFKRALKQKEKNVQKGKERALLAAPEVSREKKDKKYLSNLGDNMLTSRTDTLWSLEEALSSALFASSDLLRNPMEKKRNTNGSLGSPISIKKPGSNKSVAPAPQKSKQRDFVDVLMAPVKKASPVRRPSQIDPHMVNAERFDDETFSNISATSFPSPRPSCNPNLDNWGESSMNSHKSRQSKDSSKSGGSTSPQPQVSSGSYDCFGVEILDCTGLVIENSRLESQSEPTRRHGPRHLDRADSKSSTPSTPSGQPFSSSWGGSCTAIGGFSPGGTLARRRASASLEDVRRQREMQLTLQVTEVSENAESPVAHHQSVNSSPVWESVAQGRAPFGINLVVMLLRLIGVIPWSSGRCCVLYPWFVILVSALGVASCVNQIMQAEPDDSGCQVEHYASDLAWTLGAFASLVCSHAFRQDIFECNALLVSYASKHGCLELWAHMASWQALWTFVVWLVVVLERWREYIMGSFSCTRSIELMSGLQMMAFVFASAVISIWIHYIQYVATGLGRMVDTFIFHFMEVQNFTEAITEWNILQAVIRKVCRCIQCFFFILQTAAVGAMLLSIGDIATSYEALETLVFFIPGALIVMAITRVFFCAGNVTDKCARVPALVNSLDVGCGLDHDRLYVVEYISHSQAGFYIFEARVTTAVVMKVFYLTCIVLLSIASRVITNFD